MAGPVSLIEASTRDEMALDKVLKNPARGNVDRLPAPSETRRAMEFQHVHQRLLSLFQEGRLPLPRLA